MSDAHRDAPASRLRRLRDDAAAIGPLIDERIVLPWSGHTYDVVRPVDIDSLLDRIAGDPEQNLPYWAELWPSGIALADVIAARADQLRGERALELGGGLGLTAIAALVAGARLVVTDYAPEALLLCRLNALRNAGREPTTLRLNWRRPEPALFDLAGTGFPVVLAADVLYEQRDVEPLLDLIDRLVGRGGLLWLAEPGRSVAGRFLEAARERGWRRRSASHPGPWPDAKDAGIVVGLHELWRAAEEGPATSPAAR